jgi:MATE family multidrug resistance protein
MSRGTRISVRDVIGLAWPMTISLLSYTAMSVVDTLYVGRLGTSALAAVGLTTSVLFTALALPHGLVGGLRVATAQRTGAGEHRLARRLGWAGLSLALGCGLVLLAAQPVFLELVAHLSDDPEVVSLGRSYLHIQLLGAPIFLLSIAASAWFQGRGDTRTPMVAALTSNVLNVALDPLFIFGLGPIPELGVQGAALATVIGRFVGVSFLLWRLVPRLDGASRLPTRSDLSRVWTLGSPLGIRNLLDTGSYVLFSAMLVSVGSIDMAAHVVVVRLLSVSFLPGHAIGEAASVLVGQAVGAGRSEDAWAAFRHACSLAVGVMGLAGIAFLAVPELLVSVFQPEAEVALRAVAIVRLFAFVQMVDAVAMVGLGTLKGAGDSRFTMVAGIATTWLVQLPVAYVLAVPLGFGVWGAWVGNALEVMVVAALVGWRVRSGAWLTQEVLQADEAEERALVAA